MTPSANHITREDNPTRHYSQLNLDIIEKSIKTFAIGISFGIDGTVNKYALLATLQI